jgi:hypothetical protein
MPKPQTFPTLYDEVKTVSISFLTKHNYLKPNQRQSGVISWSRNGDNTGSISIRVSTEPQSPYLELDYKCNEAPIKYRVQLVSAPSNLGKGVVWYFVCPYTGKRCRKLYLGNIYFYHRSAFRGCMYEVQTYSKEFRELNKKFKTYFQKSKNYEQLYKKHFKMQYAGNPTKKYLKLTQQIQRAESIPYHEIERALIS